MKYYVYILTHPITEEVRYVGYTQDLKERYWNHISRTEVKNKKNSWIKSLKNVGLNPIMTVIDEANNIEEIHNLEIYWISQFRTWGFKLTNLTLGGEGTSDRIVSNEMRQHLSKTLKEKYSKEPHKLKGRKWTEEKKLQRSVERKGKIPSCSFKGKVHPNRRKVLCFKDNILYKEYNSLLEASKDLNVNVGAISNVCLNKAKSAKGFTFKYKQYEQ